MFEGKIVTPVTDDAKRLACFGIEEEYQEAFGRISEILKPHAVALSKSFMQDFFKYTGIEYSEELYQSQIEKTAEYTRNKYTPPIDGDWIRRIEKMGQLQYKAGAPIYVNMAALNSSHRLSAELIFKAAENAEEGRHLVGLFLRVAGLEAEIMVSTIQKLEQQAFDASMKTNVEKFEATIANIIERSRDQSSAAKSNSGKVASEAEVLLALSSEVAASTTQSTHAMNDVARMSGDLNEMSEFIDSELRSALSSFSELAVTAENAMQSATQLTDHRQSIERVVKLIREIADQTSILALNALIEAAQAGDAGAGFAVVANEMKELAGQTEAATQDIAAQLSGISDMTSNSISAHQSMAAKFAELEETGSKLKGTLNEQSSKVTSIAACIDETAQSAQSSAEAVAEISRRAGEVSQDVNNVADKVVELDESLEGLRSSAETFVAGMTR